GLLANAPIFVCAIVGLIVMVRRGPRRLAVELLLISVPYFLTIAAFHMWWGGYAAPARFLVPILLPFAIPAAVWFGTRTTRADTTTGAGLLLLSLAFTTTVVIADRGHLVHNFRDGGLDCSCGFPRPSICRRVFPASFRATRRRS